MIFNTDYEGDLHSLDGIKATRNGYTLEAALMHVYENECNYNSIIKAAGISELRYYQETGGNLFVQEAGAFGGFLERVKEFFKKVIEKIKEIFKSFLAKINSLVMSDKDFVKKYEKELTRRSAEISSMEFEGWKFGGLRNLDEKVKEITKAAGDAANAFSKDAGFITKTTNLSSVDGKTAEDYSSDNMTKEIEENRGKMLEKSGRYDESEFKDELHDIIYGTDKEDFKINIREQLGYIRECKKDCKEVDKMRKEEEKKIDDIIKAVDKVAKAFSNSGRAYDNDTELTGAGVSKSGTNDWDATKGELKTAGKEKVNKFRDLGVKAADYHCSVAKAAANDMVIYFGMVTQAYKDRNRQAKAICVKALSYKEESSFYGSWDDNYYNESSNDLFAGVTIK